MRGAAFLLAGMALLSASEAEARRASLVLPTLACDNSIVQRDLFDFQTVYGRDRLLDEYRERIESGQCVWLEAGTEAEVFADDGDDQLCLDIQRFENCMWVMKDSLE